MGKFSFNGIEIFGREPEAKTDAMIMKQTTSIDFNELIYFGWGACLPYFCKVFQNYALLCIHSFGGSDFVRTKEYDSRWISQK